MVNKVDGGWWFDDSTNIPPVAKMAVIVTIVSKLGDLSPYSRDLFQPTGPRVN